MDRRRGCVREGVGLAPTLLGMGDGNGVLKGGGRQKERAEANKSLPPFVLSAQRPQRYGMPGMPGPVVLELVGISMVAPV